MQATILTSQADFLKKILRAFRIKYKHNFLKVFAATMTVTVVACNGTQRSMSSAELHDPGLKNTLPKKGELHDEKPVGKNWTSMLTSLDDWNGSAEFWTLENGVLHGDYHGGEFHNYAYTKKTYKDFELQVLIRMTGKDANSGVCIRLHPTNPDNAPGYQVDMGPGYWGSLWEERRAGMVQQYPIDLASKLVNENDWNHYYVIATGHRIQAWLNGVKTIDTVHAAGFTDGSIGFQLCHGDKHTVLDVKSLYIRER